MRAACCAWVSRTLRCCAAPARRCPPISCRPARPPPPAPRRDLKGNALGGRLPARLARLPALERLHLDANALTGPLPAAWNVMPGIRYL